MTPCVFHPRDTYGDIVTLPDQLRLICSTCNTDIFYFPLWVQGAKQLILSSSSMLTWLNFCDNPREISKGAERSRAKRGLGWWVRSKLKGRYWAIYEVFQGLCLPFSVFHLSWNSSASLHEHHRALQPRDAQTACTTASLPHLSPGDREQRIRRRAVQIQDSLHPLVLVLNTR